MTKEPGKKPYKRPHVISEKVFEQAALSCVVGPITGSTLTTLKISGPGVGTTGCGYTSS